MLFEKVKRALRIKTNVYDDQIVDLINSAVGDLAIAGITVDGVDVSSGESGVVDNTVLDDSNLQRAIVTFCRMSFGSPSDYDRLKSSYDEQKSQLQSATGYTDWGDGV